MAPRVELSLGHVKIIARGDVLLRCPRDSLLASLLKENKGRQLDMNSNERDVHCLPYILHYLCTGDLIYPLHEGFHRVDALLKEMSFYGLVDEVLRNSSSGSTSGSFGSGSTYRKYRKRRSSVSSIHSTLPKSVSLNHVLNDSLTEIHQVPLRPTESSISVTEVKGQGHRDPRSTRIRFLALIKRCFNLKPAFLMDQSQPAAGGVFRPNCPNGSTVILLAETRHVTVYGLKTDLNHIFPEQEITSLATTSSAFIDSTINLDLDKVPQNEMKNILDFLYLNHLKKTGFILTVQLQWLDSRNKDFCYQWFLHRKSQERKKTIGRKADLFHKLLNKTSFN